MYANAKREDKRFLLDAHVKEIVDILVNKRAANNAYLTVLQIDDVLDFVKDDLKEFRLCL